jgi:DNA-binding NarL/FixJ family response regulator
MALTLRSDDQHRLTAMMQALLSPLDHSTREDWYRSIGRQSEELFSAHVALFVKAGEHDVAYLCEQAPAFADAHAAQTQVRHGELRSTVREHDRLLTGAHQKAVTVYTQSSIERVTGAEFWRSEFYNEVFRPLGIQSSLGFMHRSPDESTYVSLNSSRPESALCGGDPLAVLELLQPAFRAGVEMVRHNEAARGALFTAFDANPDPLLVYDTATDRELYRNHALARLAAQDHEAPALLAAMIRLARRMGSPTSKAWVPPPATLDVATALTSYRLSASHLPATIFGSERTVLIAAERAQQPLPSIPELMREWRLTRREAQVALALARGESDGAIAQVLEVSPHTVRHHVESVFAKLGVHSRKAIGLHLLQARQRGAPPLAR